MADDLRVVAVDWSGRATGAAPFIWLAVVWSGALLIFGAAGLAADRLERGKQA